MATDVHGSHSAIIAFTYGVVCCWYYLEVCLLYTTIHVLDWCKYQYYPYISWHGSNLSATAISVASIQRQLLHTCCTMLYQYSAVCTAYYPPTISLINNTSWLNTAIQEPKSILGWSSTLHWTGQIHTTFVTGVMMALLMTVFALFVIQVIIIICICNHRDWIKELLGYYFVLCLVCAHLLWSGSIGL